MNRRLYISRGFMLCGCVLSLLTVGCRQESKPKENFTSIENEGSEDEDNGDEDQIEEILAAACILEPTEGNKAHGIVMFTVQEDGVRIVAELSGLSPGKHGFHIHEKGDCGGDHAEAAGGHFNPFNKKHGGPDNVERHVGDLGNIIANEMGHAEYEFVDKLISLNGPNSIIGRSVILHEKEDDLVSQPAGNAGGRIACGIIEAIE